MNYSTKYKSENVATDILPTLEWRWVRSYDECESLQTLDRREGG